MYQLARRASGSFVVIRTEETLAGTVAIPDKICFACPKTREADGTGCSAASRRALARRASPRQDKPCLASPRPTVF